MNETRGRSAVKSATYRIGCIIMIFTLLYLIIGDVKLAGSITIIHQILVTIFYYLHERVWNRLKWGRG